MSIHGMPFKHSTEQLKKEFVKKLLKWWNVNKRDFPWRRTADPYKILIAELMLRKTTARQVATLYERFLSKYPDPRTLSEASERELEDIIRPLGMEHKRATLLKAIGNEIVKKYSGQVPPSKENLIALPGVGSYVANAILCFAYGKDVPMVDTNAIRVFQRVFDFQSNRRRPKDDPALWKFVAEVIPSGKAREFNLAIIDHAHSICTSKKPHCHICSLNMLCKYAQKRYGKI